MDLDWNLNQVENEQQLEPLSVSEGQFEPVNVELVLPINIPIGFQFSEEQVLKIYFSMDYSSLRLSKEILQVPQEVTFTDEGEQHTLQCQTPVGKYYANGVLFYNFVFGGAEPITFLDATVKRGDTVYKSTTGISSYDKLVIDQKLGYACPYDNVEEDFVFNVTIRTPYVIDENGQKVELQPVVEGNSLGEAKAYGAYYGNEYLVASNGAVNLYVPCEIVVENVLPVS